MENNRHFVDLIPAALRSVPYISVSHSPKAYCALENLYAQKPHWPEHVWEYCRSLILEDEPKVKGLIAPELLEIDAIVDPTSGRDFGPDWILSQGIMPLSYWAIQKKVEESGTQALFLHYLDEALDHPRYLGHEISVLAAHWYFYRDVLESEGSSERKALFLQRLAEYLSTTFHAGNDTFFEHPAIDSVPSEAVILRDALTNPGFFGHNVLACVWTHRLQTLMNAEQTEKALYNLTVMNRWHTFGKPPVVVEALPVDWTEEDLDEHFIRFFPDGPTNLHQITLADALLWVWERYPDYRRLCAANILCFTRGVSPA